MKFNYRARDQEGNTQVGLIEASSKEAALEILQEYGLYVTNLNAVKSNFFQKNIGLLSEASQGDIISFTEQLSIMLSANIPLVESLETIARQISKEGFREELLKVAEKVEGGSTFSQALMEFPKTFSPFFIGMIRSGEIAGKMPENLRHLSQYLEKEQAFKGQVVGALIYPAFVLVVFAAMGVLMTLFVVPSFELAFVDMGIEMPVLTKAIIEGTKLLRKWGILALLLIAGIIGGLIYWAKDKKNKKKIDKFILELPLVGPFLGKIFLTRIALNLSTLIASGVPISDSIRVTGELVNNNVYHDIILKTGEGIRAGKPMSSVLAAYPERFPFVFVQMVTVGEKTGKLERSLNSVVELYEKQIQKSLDTFTKMLEPALIIVLGLVVALFAMALFVPLFQGGMDL